MKTRSKPKASTAADTSEEQSKKKPLSQLDLSPPRVVVLPKGTSNDARFVTLQNPATETPNRYFYCPQVGLHEFTKITAEKSTPRSWLLSNPCQTNETKVPSQEAGQTDSVQSNADGKLHSMNDGYILKEPDMLVATPFDPLFLILPILLPATTSSSGKKMFLALDEHLDALGATSRDMKHLLSTSDIGKSIEQRMTIVCDSVDAGDEKMYRISVEKLVRELLSRPTRMCASGLPASMEEHFVKDALKAPILDIGGLVEPNESKANDLQSQEPAASFTEESQSSANSQSGLSSNAESQSSTNTEATSFSSDSDPQMSAVEPIEFRSTNEPPQEIVQLLRVRTALNFLFSSCVPAHIRKIVEDEICKAKLINFTPLEAHLAHIASLRQQAQALRSISDNISRKRSIEDEEVAEARAEKKRKKEEEEKKKKSESRALKDLKKADTSGMKKLSSFFTKAATK